MTFYLLNAYQPTVRRNEGEPVSKHVRATLLPVLSYDIARIRHDGIGLLIRVHLVSGETWVCDEITSSEEEAYQFEADFNAPEVKGSDLSRIQGKS